MAWKKCLAPRFSHRIGTNIFNRTKYQLGVFSLLLLYYLVGVYYIFHIATLFDEQLDQRLRIITLNSVVCCSEGTKMILYTSLVPFFFHLPFLHSHVFFCCETVKQINVKLENSNNIVFQLLLIGAVPEYSCWRICFNHGSGRKSSSVF